MRKTAIILSVIALFLTLTCKAQTNVQFNYDFGSDRQFFTATIEGSYNDDWGNTFFFIDHDFDTVNNNSRTFSPGTSYMEIYRNLNFWQNTIAAPFSLHLEYNGGHTIGGSFQNAFLAGIDYGFQSKDEKTFISLQLLYKHIAYIDKNAKSKIPLQFTAVWGINDLFGIEGLEFSGYMDFWWEEQELLFDHYGKMLPEKASVVFISEPQIWYNIGRFFDCENLSIGGEVELSYCFDATKGFWCRPACGLKWEF